MNETGNGFVYKPVKFLHKFELRKWPHRTDLSTPMPTRHRNYKKVMERVLSSTQLPGGGFQVLANAAASNGIIFQYEIMADETIPYPVLAAMMKYLTHKAYRPFEVVANPADFPEEFRRAKEYVLDSLGAGNFKPLINKTFSLAAMVDAHRYMESNAQIGKVLVTV
jgi:Zinc-binding dehydrogenase